MAITNHTLSVKEVMHYYYSVPKYQRGYVWDSERFGELLDSLLDFSQDAHGVRYFLGALVLQRRTSTELPQNIGEAYYIVDGQQRLTSLFIIMCAAINRLKVLGAGAMDIATLTSDYLVKHVVGAEPIVKILHTDPDSRAAFQSILTDVDVAPADIGRSADKIYGAFRVAKRRLEQFQADHNLDPTSMVDALIKLAVSLERVVLLPFATDSESESLEVFETLNSKNLELSNLDIIKSLLFASAGEEDGPVWERLTKLWDTFIAVFDPLNIPPNKFLRYVCVAQFLESVPTKETLKWLKGNENLTKIESDPKYLIGLMTKTATAIQSIREGKAPNGSPSSHLLNIRELAPSAEQHYYFLIPLWDQSPRIWREAFAVAETFIFANKVLARYTGNIEKNFTTWGQEIWSRSEKDGEAAAYIDSVIWPTIRADLDLVRLQLLKTSQTNSTKAFIIWLLRRCEQYAAEVAGGEVANGVIGIEHFDLEHIEPKSSNRIPAEFVASLGNLTLWEKGFNKGVKASSYEIKKPLYGNSGFRMTNSLNSIPSVGGKDLEAFNLFLQADTWSESTINIRGQKLTEILLSALRLK